MDKGCGCLIGIVIVAIWIFSAAFAEDLGLKPFALFMFIIIGGLLLLGLLGYLAEKIDGLRRRKLQTKIDQIQKEFPKAFEQFTKNEGIEINEKPLSLAAMKKIANRKRVEWLAENNRLKFQEEEERRISNQCSEIEKKYPDGLNIWKRQNVGWTNKMILDNKYHIEKLHRDYLAEEARKEKERREAEEAAKALREKERIQALKEKVKHDELLRNKAKDVFARNVKRWEYLSDNFYYTYLYYYYPTTCDFEASEDEWSVRRLVWNFKNDPDRHIAFFEHNNALSVVVPLIKKRLIESFSEESLPFLTLACLPASTNAKNQARYEEFSRRLCEETGMENAYNYIVITKDGMSKNDPRNMTGSSIQPEVRIDSWFRGKQVLLFDDVITRGNTMLRYKRQMERVGANVVGGFSIGKTKHERPGQTNTSNPFPPLPEIPYITPEQLFSDDDLPF